MSRWWTETVAALGDVVPLPLAALLLLLAALLTALAWYFFPAWVPRRLPRLRLPRLRLRRPRLRLPRPRLPRRRRRVARASTAAPTVPAPRAPEPGPVSLADRLAAEGRYAEAVRERLREMVGELVTRQIVAHRPGMTVTELTTAATHVQPRLGPTLHAAGAIFSDLWYAQRPADRAHDDRMRDLVTELRQELAGVGTRG